MRNILWKSALLAIPLFGLAVNARAQASYDLRSPDKRIEVRIRTTQGVRYDVVLKGVALLQDSSLSMDVDHKVLGHEVKVTGSKERHTDQMLEPVVRQKFAKIRDNYNELRLDMAGGYAVVFRAYNEGVAYRFETSLPAEQVKIYGEEANFRFPSNSVVFYPQEDSFFSHNERKYLPQHLSADQSGLSGQLSRGRGCGRWRKSGHRGIRCGGISRAVAARHRRQRTRRNLSALSAEGRTLSRS